jgi:hypothetical protein
VFSDALTLPGTLDLASFSSVLFALEFSNGNGTQVVKGALTSLLPPSSSPTPVPEPCTLALLGAGLIGVAGRRRRR